MALSEEDKKRIEEEESYRAGLQQKKKGGVAKGCLTIIVILFVLGVIGMLFSSPSETTNNESSTTPKTEAQIAEEKEANEAKIAELGNAFCEARSDGKPYMDLEPLAQYMNGTADPEAKVGNTTKTPTPDSCQKAAELCLSVWSDDDCQKVAEKKIWIGMNKLQLEMSWGFPKDKNNTVGTWGTHSQWVYADFGPYVYLEGDTEDAMLVTSWQD